MQHAADFTFQFRLQNITLEVMLLSLGSGRPARYGIALRLSVCLSISLSVCRVWSCNSRPEEHRKFIFGAQAELPVATVIRNDILWSRIHRAQIRNAQ